MILKNLKFFLYRTSNNSGVLNFKNNIILNLIHCSNWFFFLWICLYLRDTYDKIKKEIENNLLSLTFKKITK